MENTVYFNKQVAEIIGLTGRQVLSWSEKGLIAAHIESIGSGQKRGYSYLNLLEFGLCRKLFSIGLGFRAVKKIINDLRERDMIRSWAEDFENYYQAVFKQQQSAYILWAAKTIDDIKTLPEDIQLKIKEFEDKFLKPHKPDKPIGVLVYFFSDDEKPTLEIIPWEMDYVANLNMIKEGFITSECTLLIDIGKIKRKIDESL